MAAEGRLWTLGRWHAKPGNADDFRKAWETFANWTVINQPGAGDGYLLQDETDQDLFFSFGPWENAEAIASWRSTAEFGSFVAQVRDLCDSFEPHSLRLVAHLPEK
jgi:quinol monooxygenase YgiN